MKKEYISPELEVSPLEFADIITASVPGAGTGPDTGVSDEFGDTWD